MKKITLNELSELACKYGLELADVQAVFEVEAAGKGFLPDGKPKILFERHWFSKFTNHVYDTLYPDISSKTPGGYRTGAGEWARFDKAQAIKQGLTRDAAIKSTSWGAGQVMGFHYQDLGFETPQDFLNQNFKGEAEQFEIMLKFITLPKNTAMFKALKGKQWATFAKLYNGPQYAKNKYDTKLANAYEKHSKLIA
jgi:N-acetylmuramidase